MTEPVHPLHELALSIETGPASRELSDRVLIACGCLPEHHILPRHTKWRLPSGARFVTPPDPLKDLNVIAALERESNALPDVVTDIIRRIDVVTILEGHDFDEVRGRATIECGEHREARCRAAALCRALAARTRTDPGPRIA